MFRIFRSRRMVPLSFLVLAATGFATPSHAATTVRVTLWDKGGNAAMPTDLGMGAKDLSKATMGVRLSTATVPAGDVTFEVTNDSGDTVHEMIVAPVPPDGKPLPYVPAAKRVDEDAARDLGEVSELDPGKSGALQLNLKPGKYVLFCNIAGHYMAGMWSVLTVG